MEEGFPGRGIGICSSLLWSGCRPEFPSSVFDSDIGISNRGVAKLFSVEGEPRLRWNVPGESSTERDDFYILASREN